ncbi:hypothetical protein N8481_02120 [Akkermansiaceae bacterium]|nr:hypothetical protein [Akkermansiaceae bacterium]
MTQDTWNFIFIGLSFALYIGIAVRQRAGSTKEYYTAGGGVSPFANGMATAADWMSAATFISMARYQIVHMTCPKLNRQFIRN